MNAAYSPADPAGDFETLPVDPATTALGLAALGLAVLPCRADKSPAAGWGVTRATTDPQVIVDAFIDTAAPLVGVACGASGVIVVDIDRHPGGADGFASLAEAGPDLPPTWRHTSISGAGEHAVYAVPAGVDPAPSRPFPGVDLKAGAGYVVWSGGVPASRAEFAPAPPWTIRPRAAASAPTWTASVAEWLTANDGPVSGGVADAVASLPEHGSIAEPDLLGLAVRIVGAARFDTGGAAALAELRSRYASGQWAATRFEERVDRAIARAIEAEGRPRLLGDVVVDDISLRALGLPAPAATSVTAPAAPFRLISRSELRNRPKPEWLIEGLLQGSGVLVLAGQGGIGKSFLALDWSAHLATGRRWHGRTTKRARVVYVAAEGAEFFHDRLDAWEVHNRALVPDEGLLFVDSGFNLSDAAAVAHMRDLVAREAFDLIVLDTLSQLSAVESENDNAQLAAVIRQARAIREARPGASVLIVHHVNKSERGRVRGASAIRDNADTVIVARADGQGFALSTRPEDDGKMKNATAEYLAGFRLASVEASAVIAREAPQVDLDGAAIETVLAIDGGHPIGDFLAARGDASNATAQRIKRRLGKLVESGVVVAEGGTSDRRWSAVT